MNEKIKETAKSTVKVVKDIAMKNSSMFFGAALVASVVIAYGCGMKTGEIVTANFVGGMLNIYPKDNTVGQFLEDLGKMRG